MHEPATIGPESQLRDVEPPLPLATVATERPSATDDAPMMAHTWLQKPVQFKYKTKSSPSRAPTYTCIAEGSNPNLECPRVSK